MHSVLTVLGLALLMVVHEAGHMFSARYFGMRVEKFSIGFGPTLWRHQKQGSSTVYQVGIIPFLAYVKIAGLNPYEDIDPKDPESYANASLWGRFCTIAAGPATNYLFASILLFGGFLLAGHAVLEETSMRVSTFEGGPARLADVRDGDKIVKVDGAPVPTWETLKKAVAPHAGEPITVTVERDGKSVDLHVTPLPKGDKHAGKIMIGPFQRIEQVGVLEAARLSVTEPPKVVYDLVEGIAKTISERVAGKEDDLEFVGPVGIFRMTKEQVQKGPGVTLQFLGRLSAYLAGMNLLPIPALDGGRLLFLLFEATSRRRADAKVEARVHALALVMMLSFMLFLTYGELAHPR